MTELNKDRVVAEISQRLSLRKPQAEALRRLDTIVGLIDPKKGTDVEAAREQVRQAFSEVTDADFADFERDFPSVCFSVATGVGKTRLMGAFISYLHMIGKSQNFFILAPNLTIYEKLLFDFDPRSPKYVFQGIQAFAHNAPLIVNAENYEEGRGVRGGDLFGRESVIINIFNISKINSEVRGGAAPRIKRLQEYIGDSYFSYLSELEDLVLLMDEAHRYRGSAGFKAIAELQPIMGLEVTATPKTTGSKPQAFKNVVYRYELPDAMEDGYVKEPAIGTRANFDPKSVDPETLERIMLEDGINYHEHVKVALETYANNHDKPIVRPFMLVVTKDTAHASEVRKFVESDDFFAGRYRGRVIEIHSKTSGQESDENAQRLLNIEKSGDTDIVIHVNKLKEGWDVTNLFTIVPLRASASDILTEQTLGRGLRLPYGKRTGVAEVDQLTVISHDRFDALIELAKTENGVTKKLKQVFIGDGGDVPSIKPQMVTAQNTLQHLVQSLAKPSPEPSPQVSYGSSAPSVPLQAKEAPASFTLDNAQEVELAEAAIQVVVQQAAKKVGGLTDLKKPEVQDFVLKAVQAVQAPQQALFPVSTEKAQEIVKAICEQFVEKIIPIPALTITPTEDVSFGFKSFRLDLKHWNYQPLAQELLIQVLRTEKRQSIIGDASAEQQLRPEDFIVSKLIDFPEIDYEAHAEILYDLAGQVVKHFAGKYEKPEELQSVLQGHSKQMAAAIFAEMKKNMWRGQTKYRVTVDAAFQDLRPQNFEDVGSHYASDFRKAPEKLSEIKKYIFSGFRKSCYHLAKFDSDTERQMSELLEKDPSVRLWMKPGPNQFKLYSPDGLPYQPDFVVERSDRFLIIESKRADQMKEALVLQKAELATLWAHLATVCHSQKVGGKPWVYLLVPHTAVSPNTTLSGLVASYTCQADAELLTRYELSNELDLSPQA
ncbi:DEAD/DEAH box helicase family protein [Halopseudomonas pelagia]|uniref:DEAD/DEAH box helicase family protein n=1 Tax=Halopseudomonas pelagia TaxID=553151 RepID=UPI0030DB03FD|tara:strand:- start:4265 stop:7090 length:2826 start_codon:yes stop_codon:yes gene_type:complete